MFNGPLGPLFSAPAAYTPGFLTCSGCGRKSEIVDVPTGSMSESEWTTWARIKLGWRIDCPDCDPPDRPVDPELAARPIPRVLRL